MTPRTDDAATTRPERRRAGTRLSAVRWGVALVAVATALAGCTSPRAPEPTPTTSPTPTRTATPTPTPTPTPEAVDPFGEGPVDILLVGTDSRDPADLTGNADTIMLVHLPADRASVALVSFTRDMWVPIPGVGEGKINSAFSRGGTETLAATVSQLLGGVEIDVTVQTNFAGFIALTRALDGFEVENRHASTVTVSSTGRVVEFPQGRIRLENTDGLIYVRQRKGLPLGDLDRAERQRAALVGIMERVKQRAQEPQGFVELVTMLHRNVKVTGDVSLEDMIALAPMVGALEAGDVVSLQVPITGFGNIGGASVNLVDGPRTAELGAALRDDDVARYVATYGTDYTP
ncbi:LCP family protein [Actinotalea sp. AC32]|nr:LCP family protein [Actinotalea sp. AC32]